jgi:signal transduction histidine kinase
MLPLNPLLLLTHTVYVLLCLVLVARAVNRPSWVNIDTAAFFACVALVVVLSDTASAFNLRRTLTSTAATGALTLALPFLLLRLVDDFQHIPFVMLVVAGAGTVLAALALFAAPTSPPWLSTILSTYFVVVVGYAALCFARHARAANRVTRYRLGAVVVACVCLALAVVFSVVATRVVGAHDTWKLLSDLASLASALSFFIGFAPPTWLEDAWREPEVRSSLRRASELARLPDLEELLAELEDRAAHALGWSTASVGYWHEPSQTLRFFEPDGTERPLSPSDSIAGHAFSAQSALFVPDAAQYDPSNADLYRRQGVRAALAAPITASQRRLGVLLVYGPLPPIFADSDLALVELLADQAALILENRALIDASASVRAREETARLKEDFLSSAAHDLRTPLTGILAQAQLLKRRAELRPNAPPDLVGIDRLIAEGRRLSTLVTNLLDGGRVAEAQLVVVREYLDLTELVHDVCQHSWGAVGRCRVEASGPVLGAFDPVRIRQLLENLIDNGVKFSPPEAVVSVRVWQQSGWAKLDVADQGIGIPPSDLAHLFERFHRASNVDDRRYAGLGLGLFICHGIVQQHGGAISVDSRVGVGSTFHVELPLTTDAGPSVSPPATSEVVGRG